ncbi:MAG TPA: TorF family putative porin [Allosphingosinicella sp.]|jgi:uncharacterized protein (TIGR02001 family)
MNFKHRALACALCILGSASPAMAVDLPGGFSATGGASIVSDYRFRGISLSGNDPAVQGTVTISHSSGFYAGTWASTLEDTDLYGDTEIDLYAGWAKNIAPGTQVDVGVAYYAYPNGRSAAGNSDYAESYAKLSHTIATVKGTVGAAYAWGQSAIGERDNLYLFADAAAGVPGTPFTLRGHAGRSEGSLSPQTYVDWSLGVDATFGPLTLGASYLDSDLDRPVGKGALVFSFGAAF